MSEKQEIKILDLYLNNREFIILILILFSLNMYSIKTSMDNSCNVCVNYGSKYDQEQVCSYISYQRYLENNMSAIDLGIGINLFSWNSSHQ